MKGMRTLLTVQPHQMREWREICVVFAEKVGAKLLFVNETSCGLEYPDGTLWHPTVEDMQEYLLTHN